MEENRGTRSRINMTMQLTQFQLPPIKDALIIGKRTAVGAQSIARAFQEMSPNIFQLVRVEHPVIEAILVRRSDLRKLSEKQLISRLLSQAEKIMDQEDTLHVRISLEVIIEEAGIEV